MAERNHKKALKLADGSRWAGDWVMRRDDSYAICCFSHDLPATLELDGTWCFASDALAAVRAKGQDPEYLELLKVRAQIERLKEQVEGLRAQLAVVQGMGK